MDNAAPAHRLSPVAAGIRRVLANCGLLIGGKSVSGLLGLAYLALAVRTLGVETFGSLIVIQTVVEIAQTLVKFQTWQPILRYGTAALQHGRLDDLRRLVVFAARLDIGSAVIGAVGAAATLWLFGTTLGLPADVLPAATLYAGSLLFMITSTPTGLLRLFDRFNLVVLEGTVEALVRLLGGVALYVAGGGLDAFLVLWGVSAAAGALTSIGLAWREVRLRGLWRRTPGRRPLTDGFDGIWRFVLNTNANSSLALLTNQLATLVVGMLIGPSEAALFRIARQVAEAAAKPVKLMTTAIYPEFARFAAQDLYQTMRVFLGRTLRLSAVGTIICAVVLYLAGPWILALIGGPEVATAFPTLLLLGGAALIGVGTFALEPALISIGRAALALRIRLAAAGLYLPALAILVPLAGIEGAGIAAVVAAASIAVMQSLSVLSCFRISGGNETRGNMSSVNERLMAEPALSGLVVGDCRVQLWGMTGTERARRTLKKAGARMVASGEGPAAQAQACLMARADWVIDPALIGLLAKAAGSVLVTRVEGRLVPLAAHVAAADVAATARSLAAPADSPQPWPEHLRVVEHDPAAPFLYLAILRKRLKPVVMPLTAATVAAAERATFAGSYKGVTDVVTKYLWPTPARRVTRWCALAGLSPNAVTLVSLVLVFVAMALFAQGDFLAGLAVAWVMTFLDTVDGKLARVTLTSTRFGNVFDHGIDLIHPPFWWLAWHWGCVGVGVAYPSPDLTLAVVLAGYAGQRLLEFAFVQRHGFQVHVWRRFDSRFRLVVARRNPNLIVLTVFALAGLPGWGLGMVAIWTAISIGVQAVQLVQAELSVRRGGTLSSWLAAP